MTDKKKLLAMVEALQGELRNREEHAALTQYKPQSFHWKFFSATENIRLFVGSNQCLGGETEIYDPVLDVKRRIDEIDGNHHVIAWNGQDFVTAAAKPPFAKEASSIYRFYLDNGQSFTASVDHKILTQKGFCPISSLLSEETLHLARSTGDVVPSTHDGDDAHLLRTIRGFRSDYQACPRSCDEQPLLWLDSDLLPLPLLGDAQGHTYHTEHMDEWDGKLIGSHSYRSFPHLSSLGGALLLWGQYAESSGPTPYSDAQLCFYSRQESQQPASVEARHPQSACELVPYSKLSCLALDSPLLVKANITSVEYLRDDVKWDFTVPIYHNYWAEGAIHHNSGKTSIAAQIAVGYCLGYFPWIRNFYEYVKNTSPEFPYPGWWFDSPEEILKYEVPPCKVPCKVAVVAIDFKSAVVEKILEIIPKPHRDGPMVKRIEKAQHNIHRIFFQNGSMIQFFSSVQDAMHFEGGTWDLQLFDEPPKQEHFVAMERGAMVKSAPRLFSMTPLNEPWIHDTLMAEAGKAGSNTLLVTCDLYDREIHWITSEKKKKFEETVRRKNPHEVQARVHGKFTHLMGRIFPMYDENVHRRPAPECALLPGYTYGLTVDPHDRKPFMLAWWYLDPFNNITFFKEWPNTLFHEMKSCDYTVQQYVEMFRDVEKNFPAPVTHRYIDPNSGPKRNAITGQSFVDAFALEGFYFDHNINDSLEYGHGVLRDLLWYNTAEEVSGTNSPKIFISEDCFNLDFAMQRYVWDEKSAKEKPHEKYKDPVDVLRYTAVKQPVWIEPGGGQVFDPGHRGSVF